MEIGPADDVFAGPHHPYTEALLSAVPTLDDLDRLADPARGRDPQRRRPAARLPVPDPLPTQDRRDLRDDRARADTRTRPGHGIRCQHPARRAAPAPGDRRCRRPGWLRPPACTRPGRRARCARACCANPVGPVAVETVLLDPPRSARWLVRIAAAGVCHSDLRLADGALGDGRWPIVLGHEGGGDRRGGRRRRRSRRVPGDHVGVLLRPRLRRLRDRAAPAGRRCASRPDRHGVSRHAARRQLTAPRRLGRRRAPARIDGGLLCASTRSSAGAGAIPIPRTCRCGRRRCSAAAWSPASARSPSGPACERRAGMRGRLRRGRAAGDRGGAARGRGAIVAVERRPEKLEHALRAARRTRSTRRAAIAARRDPAISGGGVEHAFEVVGTPAHDPARVGRAARRAAPRSSSGWRRPASRSRCRRSSCSPRSDPGQLLRLGRSGRDVPGLVELVRPGRLELADVVSARDRARRACEAPSSACAAARAAAR